ncbi:sugar ABC transporter ATP-binding protein [Streptosporangium sp. NPDC049046]|uniref:sugar ABC transporter ATP-binding protein n=1 Tax=unclassified Streptosporangium TaxID=2632669 RepID=UPI00342D5AE6
MDTRIELVGVSKSFGGAAALQEIDFAVRSGEVHALVGMNGAGKSTLVKILSGALTPDSGEVLIDGGRHGALTPRRTRTLGVSIVYQHRTLVPQLTVAENMLLGRLPKRMGAVDWRRAHTEAAMALSTLGVEVSTRAITGELGQAQQTLVEIAREVATGGKVLILDEPTASLGGADAVTVHDLVRKLSSTGISVIYISHHLDEVLGLAERITVLRDGRRVTTVAGADMDLPKLVRAMTGERLNQERPQRVAPAGETVIEIDGLASGRRLAELTLSVRASEVVAVLGPAGDGQSELFPLLSGQRRPSGGRVRIAGTEVASGSVGAALSAGLRCITGDRLAHGLVSGLTVDENLDLTRRGLDRPWLVRWKRLHREASVARSRYGVTTIQANPPVSALSGGNQQKVLLAKWLDSSVRACLLEEPTNGVDVAAKSEIHHLIDNLAERGTAVLLASTDVEEVLRLADRVVVVRAGRVVADLPVDGISRDALVSLTVGGTAS